MKPQHRQGAPCYPLASTAIVNSTCATSNLHIARIDVISIHLSSSIDLFKRPTKHTLQKDLTKYTMSDIVENHPSTGTQGDRGPAQELKGLQDKDTQTDKDLALRLSALSEDANGRVTPLCRMIRKLWLFFLSPDSD